LNIPPSRKGCVPWNKGKICPSISVAKKGKKFSDEGLRNILEARHKRKGLPSPRKGMKCSEETKIKLSLAHKGRPSKLKGKKTGRHSWNYKGKSDLNHLLRTSKDWVRWRLEVFERDKFTCQKCNKKGIYIEPHHIVTVKECRENNKLDLVFDVNNGLTLCRTCHLETHNWKIKNIKGD